MPSPYKHRLLVLGLGNDILTDDSVGLRVASRLEERFAGRQDVAVTQSCEMGLSLLDMMVDYQTVVLVDAVRTLAVPVGYLHELEVENLHTLPGFSPHFLGVGEVLALGRKLGLVMPARVKIFAVEVEDALTVGTQLTSQMETALPVLVERITTVVEGLSRGGGDWSGGFRGGGSG